MNPLLSKLVLFLLVVIVWTPPLFAQDTLELEVQTQIQSIWTDPLFKGEATTDITKVEQLEKAEDVTLDSKTFTFRFTDPLDLTNPRVIEGLEAIKTYWTIKDNSLEVSPLWYSKFQITVPIEVTLKQKNLTKSSPRLSTPIEKKNEPLPKVETANGKHYFSLKGPINAYVAPNIVLNGENGYVTNSSHYLLKGTVSHNDVTFFINQGSSSAQLVKPQSFHKKTGEFAIPVSFLQKGIILYK